MNVKDSSPVVVKASGRHVVIWLVAENGESSLTRVPCVSEEHAEEFAAIANRAFGIRSVENSFTTGLLHKDIEIACGL